jgi:hypothetical protein
VTTWQEELASQEEAESAMPRAWLPAAAEEAQEREQSRQQACEAFGAEAEAEGYCVRCWARSTSWGLYLGNPKKIRHRKPENCPNQRRRVRR